MQINEIFKSIQGESTYQGLPCTFIRFSGCNLNCSYCDTNHQSYIEMEENEIIKEVDKKNCELIEITGGEPLLQEGVYNLIDKLLDKGYQVLVETNGSLPIDKINPNAIRIIDIKCPDSNMSEYMDWNNLYKIKKEDQIKFVISSKNDYDWAKSIIKKYNLNKKVEVLFSPAFNILNPNLVANWLINDNIFARLQIQLHKYIKIK